MLLERCLLFASITITQSNLNFLQIHEERIKKSMSLYGKYTTYFLTFQDDYFACRELCFSMHSVIGNNKT